MSDKRQWMSLSDLKSRLGKTDEPEPDTPAGPMGSVYSTEHGRLCGDCGHSVAQCQCRQRAAVANRPTGKLRIRRETKGRKGKGVTVIEGLPQNDDEIAILARELRQHCGVGGTHRSGVIELQGDQQDKARAFLAARGLLKG